MNPLDDTICAIATAQGEGAISIIRVSGKNSIEIVDSMFHVKHILSKSKGNRIHYGKILDSFGETIDDVLALVFREPNSYTGENSVEINTHSSTIIVKRIIEELLDNGCRLAEPGEFTKRAFLNGKMDLAQAEAVLDVINSRSEASLKGARNQLDGLLSNKVNYLRSSLINVSSLLELELDFVEEDIQLIPLESIINDINSILNELNALLNSYSFGKVLKDGVNVALVGKPNAGKSSLLNYMVKDSRAIVSEIPGTTRDVIREDITIDGILFKIFDTAGIRNSNDAIEKEGVERSINTIKLADIVIFLNDITLGIDDLIYEKLTQITDKKRIITVYNKIDLIDDFESTIYNGIVISAKTGFGIESLFDSLKKSLNANEVFSEKNVIVNNLRHYNSLKQTKNNLQSFIESANSGMSQEYLAVDLRNAIQNLGEIIGIVTSDEILNNVFSQFCIGK